jgi:tryptophanyl-tRNA synthetase
MGKSLDNAIYLTDEPKTVERKVMAMYTDPKRIRATDPGTVEGNPVFVYHDSFNPNKAQVDDLKARYREGKVGDVEVKRTLLGAIEEFLRPIRERRAEYAAKPKLVDEILTAGSERARKEAAQTLHEVRAAMKLDYFGR